MSQALRDAIADLQKKIADIETEKITPLKKAINGICLALGEPEMYVDDAASAGVKRGFSWAKDQFFTRPLAACVTEYLEARKSNGMEGPASVEDIFQNLKAGGYRFEGVSGNEENNKRALKISLTKNTAQFVKISEDVFGLKKWYNIRTPRRTNGPDETAPDPGEELTPTVDPATPQAPAKDEDLL